MKINYKKSPYTLNKGKKDIDEKNKRNKDFSRTNIGFVNKEQTSFNESLADKEKLQEAIEAHLKSKDIDNKQFKDLMVAYGKRYSHFDSSHIEDLINTRRVEPTHIMKGIGDIKHKIDYLDLKETYFDSFLSIGKFDQGATLMKIK